MRGILDVRIFYRIVILVSLSASILLLLKWGWFINPNVMMNLAVETSRFDSPQGATHEMGTAEGKDVAGKTVVTEHAKAKAQWTKESHIDITERQFVASEENQVFILGVVAKNSTPYATWDHFAIYGQWYFDINSLTGDSLRCCFKNYDGYISEEPTTSYNIRDNGEYMRHLQKARLLLWHITCTKPSFDPTWVSIVRSVSCTNEHVTYLKPFYATKRPDGHITITTKFAYGHIHPTMVISFLETMKHLGVDKVVTYVRPDLDLVVDTILRYYSYIGLVDYYMIELADPARVPHKFPPLNAQYMSDEWIIKKDALERNIGSTYFGIFDMDEFLIPAGNRSIKQLLSDLLTAHPATSHFVFQNIHFFFELQTQAQESHNCTFFQRFLHTSPLRFNNIHEKLISITTRIVTQSLHNHYVKSLPGYDKLTCPNEEAYVRHYGGCTRKFPQKICANQEQWIRDETMAEWANKTIDRKVFEVSKLVGIL